MMAPQQIEQVLRDVDTRASKIERILPTLATKKDLSDEGELSLSKVTVTLARPTGSVAKHRA